jgi:hypothetical protein
LTRGFGRPARSKTEEADLDLAEQTQSDLAQQLPIL